MRTLKISSLLIAGGLALCPLGALADSFVLTFDAGSSGGALTEGAVLGNQYAGLGVLFSPNAFTGAGSSTSGQPWATNTSMVVTATDLGGLGTPSLVSGLMLHAFGSTYTTNGWLAENGDPSLRATFSTPISTLSAAFAGVATPADVKLFAYNGTTLLTTATMTATTGQQVLTVSSATPITSVAFQVGSFNDWVAVDNIAFTTINAVPEPGTVLAGGAALTLAGAYLRKRRSSKKALAA